MHINECIIHLETSGTLIISVPSRRLDAPIWFLFGGGPAVSHGNATSSNRSAAGTHGLVGTCFTSKEGGSGGHARGSFCSSSRRTARTQRNRAKCARRRHDGTPRDAPVFSPLDGMVTRMIQNKKSDATASPRCGSSGSRCTSARRAS